MYITFLFDNSIFWFCTILSCAVFLRLDLKIKRLRIDCKIKNIKFIIICFYLFCVLFYEALNIATLGIGGFYSGCHYCGPPVLGGFGLLSVIIFDLGTVLVLLFPFYYINYGKRKLITSLYILTIVLTLVYFYVGSYRNQLLPIVFCYSVIFFYRFSEIKRKIYYTIFLMASPVAAISMAFFHYFESGDSKYTLLTYFSKNEFFSNYNNFIIYNNGFRLDLPFSGASYLGPLLYRLNSFIDTGFSTSASQMARYMRTGIGYGFSPLLESLLNFGDYFFLASIIIGLVICSFKWIIDSSESDLTAIIYFSLFIFYIFNINRVDFTAAFNVTFHKLILIFIVMVFKYDKNKNISSYNSI
ncbi:hypothetical protein [Vibrio tritonius]|uniref:hypothetical protein n=1 Tax=Vibrio tritonius TaxID=1435069 RepID=UPI00315DBA53